jgi:hypothetical protein
MTINAKLKRLKRASQDVVILEELASAQHDIWAHWMKYLFSKCITPVDGSCIILPADVERWKRQCATSYDDLSEDEKESDRRIVRRFILGGE